MSRSAALTLAMLPQAARTRRRTRTRTLARNSETAAGGDPQSHHAAGCPVPTNDVSVSETLAGIRREAAKKSQTPQKKVAATATVLRRLVAPIPDDLLSLSDRAILLVVFARELRRSELAAMRNYHTEKSNRGVRLTLPKIKGEQTDAVTVPVA